jgi:cytochrome c biogenesis protein CcmG/thiol:disulfide interchange protein DsbE
MDSNSGQSNSDHWVEKRLAELDPGSEWQPDLSRGLARFEERRAMAGDRKRRWAWLVAGTVAAALPLMAFPSTRAFAQRCVSACVSQSNRVYDIFARVPGSASSVFVKAGDRRMAPDFELDDASGKPVKLSEFRGQVVLLNFWATWCAPCRIEIPWFIEFQKTLQSRGLATLGVSLDEDGWDAVRPYIDEHKINYRVMVGNDDLAQQYGATSLPTTFLIDRSGRIAATHVGLCGKGEYEADIKAVLNEQ